MRTDATRQELLAPRVVPPFPVFGSGRRTATLVSPAESRALSLDYHRFQCRLLAFPEASLVLPKLAIERLLDQVNAAHATAPGAMLSG